MVLVPVDEILGGRADLHQIRRIPRPAQRDRRLVEENVDVCRLIRLAGAALLGLLDQPDDRGETLGERLLVGEIGVGDGRNDECSDRGQHEQHHAPSRSR